MTVVSRRYGFYSEQVVTRDPATVRVYLEGNSLLLRPGLLMRFYCLLAAGLAAPGNPISDRGVIFHDGRMIHALPDRHTVELSPQSGWRVVSYDSALLFVLSLDSAHGEPATTTPVGYPT